MSNSQSTTRYLFPARLRVKSRQDFDAAFARGKVIADATLVVQVMRESVSETQTRLGLSLSKKVGNSPIRNRWKRLIREAFRLNHAQLPTGYMLVIRPRKGAKPEFYPIQQSIRNLARRLARQR